MDPPEIPCSCIPCTSWGCWMDNWLSRPPLLRLRTVVITWSISWYTCRAIWWSMLSKMVSHQVKDIVIIMNDYEYLTGAQCIWKHHLFYKLLALMQRLVLMVVSSWYRFLIALMLDLLCISLVSSDLWPQSRHHFILM